MHEARFTATYRADKHNALAEVYARFKSSLFILQEPGDEFQDDLRVFRIKTKMSAV